MLANIPLMDRGFGAKGINCDIILLTELSTLVGRRFHKALDLERFHPSI